MAELTAIQQQILEVLSIQSSGYLTSPEASAFVAVGLDDPEVVQEECIGLQDAGFAEFFTEEEHIDTVKIQKDDEGNPVLDESGAIMPALDADGNIQIETIVLPADHGWVITDKGREALK